MLGSTKGLGSSTPTPGVPQYSGPAELSVNTGGLSVVAVATERQLCPESSGEGLTEAS